MSNEFSIDVLDEVPAPVQDPSERADPPRGARLVAFSPGSMPVESPLEQLAWRSYRGAHLAVVYEETTADALQRCGEVLHDQPVDPTFAVTHRLVDALDQVAKVVAVNQMTTAPREVQVGGYSAELPYPVLTDEGFSFDASLHLAAQAALFGVVNMSLGPPTALHPVSAGDPVQWATRHLARACVVVAAAGNSGSIPDQETMSAWAEPPWVLAVGATRDEGGLERLPRSSVGRAEDPASGPDVMAWGASRLNLSKLGTSFAAPRVSSIARLCVAAVLQLLHLHQRSVGEAEGVRVVGLAVVDRFRGDRWYVGPDRIGLGALPLEGPTDAAVAVFESLAQHRPSLRLSCGPQQVRELLRRAANPIPNLAPHEQGAGFLSDAGVEALLSSMPATELLGALGWEDVARTLPPVLNREPLFSVTGVSRLAAAVEATSPVLLWDYMSGKSGRGRKPTSHRVEVEAAMVDQEVRVVVFSDEEADLAAIGETQGLRRDDQAVEELALDPLTAAVLIGSALAVGQFVMHVIDVVRGGVRVDLGDPPTIKRDRSVPFGWAFIFTKDGDKVDIEVKDEPKSAVERMFEAVFKLPVDATVSMVKAAIEAAKGAANGGDQASAGEQPATA